MGEFCKEVEFPRRKGLIPMGLPHLVLLGNKMQVVMKYEDITNLLSPNRI